MTVDLWVARMGWFASIMAILMYASWIDQIRLNLSGVPGSVLLPLATVINCGAWIGYGLLRKPWDLPLVLCNVLGLLVSLVTVFTALL